MAVTGDLGKLRGPIDEMFFVAIVDLTDGRRGELVGTLARFFSLRTDPHGTVPDFASIDP